ncbi:MAG: glycosyltransferase family 2 protein [Chitinophagaceae bacterium]|nr:glycosyltransferase family 2 protein [Chitinophagaceae bacterium]
MLSVIIVNYNVKYFLEQCLLSVYKAGINLSMEIIVIDNNSGDGSAAYIRKRFPAVKYQLINKNLGFAKACNYGLQLSQGTHILFLNPDTILPEDSLEKCIRFLDSYANAGALGVRMLDGSGNFLKESKRGNPTLRASFFKLSGLSALFPNSAFFAAYYMAHLSEHKTNVVDILSGAFIMTTKKVLDITGGFDEAFFMYGEDIDLSYTIQKAGFLNYYYPEITIIHFKGESTQKESLRYLRTFYKAMSIFAGKHYKGFKGIIYRIIIECAILLSVSAGLIINFVAGLINKIKAIAGFKKSLSNKQPLIITGSPESVEIAMKIAAHAGFKVIPKEQAENTCQSPVVYCEGSEYSFKAIIKQWDEEKPETAMIYANGSTSITGSPGKNKTGETIAW